MFCSWVSQSLTTCLFFLKGLTDWIHKCHGDILLRRFFVWLGIIAIISGSFSRNVNFETKGISDGSECFIQLYQSGWLKYSREHIAGENLLATGRSSVCLNNCLLFYLLEMLVQFCLKSMEGCRLFQCPVCDQFSLPLQLSCSSMCLNNFSTPARIDLSLIKSAVMDLINRSILAKSS